MTSPSDNVLCGLHVLVAEDQWLSAIAMADLLTKAGATVAGPVASVSAGLDLVAGTPYLDVAVLDVKLDDGMVYPLADLLRAQGVPLVFATGYGTAHGSGRFAEAPHLSKVASDEEVIRTVLEAVHRG